MRDLLKDRRGGVAVWFALSVIPLLAVMGAAIDYSRMSVAREHLRSASDQLALMVATADNPSEAQKILRDVRAQLESDMDGVQVDDIKGSWIDSGNFRTNITASMDTSILAAVPGMPKSVAVTVTSVANRIPPVYRVLPPKTSLLEPEAGDYNRIYLYCYDVSRKAEADKGRREFVPIADNGTPPTDFASAPDYKLPECKPGEVVAYMLRNVRNARTDKSRWDTEKDYYEYFTDTQIDPNTFVLTNKLVGEYITKNKQRSAVDLTNKPMLETILCNSDDECRPTDKGGILPTRRTNRDPAVASQGCPPGKLMYYGYEDRPGGDRDYDDIRLVVSCPETIKVQDKQVRIVM